HADAHAGFEWDRVKRVGLALQAGEGRPRVRERVDPDAEPGDAVATADADEAEEEDDKDTTRVEVLQVTEVEDDDDADENPQPQKELTLRDQVRLAGLIDQLRDLPHGRVHGQVLELTEDHEAEDEAEAADPQAEKEQGASRHPGKRDA